MFGGQSRRTMLTGRQVAEPCRDAPLSRQASTRALEACGHVMDRCGRCGDSQLHEAEALGLPVGIANQKGALHRAASGKHLLQLLRNTEGTTITR